MKKVILITCIIIAIVIALVAFLFVFAISGAFAILMPEPPEPQITYGEFPFTITYEVNGEIFTYEDVVICEYEGIKSLGTAGKYRQWSERLKSGNEYIILLKSNINGSDFEISFPFLGFPEYYMGDFEQSVEEYERILKDDKYFTHWENGNGRSIKKEEAWQKYGIRIINIETSPPIENTFE